MKPDYRKQIADKFNSKIETMVRKSGKAKLEDAPDDMSPCPYCQAMVPDYTLVCSECKSEIPFCIVSVSIKNCVFAVVQKLLQFHDSKSF